MSVFLDLSKAFDTISHEILLNKLDYMGIRGLANQWFESYLSDRLQYLEISGEKSPYKINQFGVPQGSILGPILFLIYVNDIRHSSSLTTLCFADDTTISFSSNNVDLLYSTMNRELNSLNQWFRANKLCLNVTKTKYIVFRPTTNHHNLMNRELIINNQPLERIGHNENLKSFKFLGLNIDETLSWRYHTDSISKKLARSNYIINKVKNILPENSLLTLYQTLIHCHLNYGLEIWGSCNTLNKLVKLQKKSIRIISKVGYNHHTEPLFKHKKVLKLHDQYKLNVLSFMHRLKSGSVPDSFQVLDYFRQIIRPTREIHLYLAHTMRSRTKYTSDLPLHKFSYIWNQLDHTLQKLASFSMFKRKVCVNLLRDYRNHVTCDNIRCSQCFRL